MGMDIASKPDKTVIVVEGDLVVSDSEGGFGPDRIEIAGYSVSEIIAKFFGVQLTNRGSLGVLVEFGRVRLTLERDTPRAESNEFRVWIDEFRNERLGGLNLPQAQMMPNPATELASTVDRITAERDYWQHRAEAAEAKLAQVDNYQKYVHHAWIHKHPSMTFAQWLDRDEVQP